MLTIHLFLFGVWYRMERRLLRKGRTISSGLVAPAIGVLFGILLLDKVAFAVAHYFSHMTQIILIVP